jgi:aryl-alcohol dehydrogenase-like predicted oxidoreductase
MNYRTLGRTGLSVSVMGLGCGGHSRLGMAQQKGEDNAVAVVRRALDLGINFVDTAESYGTEPVVGRALRESGARDGVVLSTKVSPRESGALRTPAQIKEAAEAGLRRLETDHVDILHLHGVRSSEYEYCRDELVPALFDLRQAGKIRFVGITEAFGPDPRHDMLIRAVTDDCWDVMMVGFNFANQSARDRVFAATIAKDIGVLDMFAVRRALTTLPAVHELMAQLSAKNELPPAAAEALASGSPLGFLFDGPDAAQNIADAAYRFCRDEPGIHVVLSGTGSIAHLEDNAVSLMRSPLPPAHTERLYQLFEGVDSVSGN